MTDHPPSSAGGRRARRSEFSFDYAAPRAPDTPALLDDWHSSVDARLGGPGAASRSSEASQGVIQGMVSAVPVEPGPDMAGDLARPGMGTLPRLGVPEQPASMDAFRSGDALRPSGPTRGSTGTAEALAARAADVARRLGMAAGPTASLRVLAEGTDDAFVAALAELVAHQPSTSTAGDRVMARGQAALVQLLTRTGGVLGPEDAVRRIGVTREALRLWRADRRVLAFARGDGAFVYPAAQFTAGVTSEGALVPIPGLRKVLPIVLAARRTPMAAFTWMAVRRTSLGDEASGASARSVFEALAAGDLEQVLTYTQLALRSEAEKEADQASAASAAVPAMGQALPDDRDSVRDAETAAAIAALTDIFMSRLEGEDDSDVATPAAQAAIGSGRPRETTRQHDSPGSSPAVSRGRRGATAETAPKVAAKSRTSSAEKASGGKGAKTASQGGKTSEKTTGRTRGTRGAPAREGRTRGRGER